MKLLTTCKAFALAIAAAVVASSGAQAGIVGKTKIAAAGAPVHAVTFLHKKHKGYVHAAPAPAVRSYSHRDGWADHWARKRAWWDEKMARKRALFAAPVAPAPVVRGYVARPHGWHHKRKKHW